MDNDFIVITKKNETVLSSGNKFFKNIDKDHIYLTMVRDVDFSFLLKDSYTFSIYAVPKIINRLTFTTSIEYIKNNIEQIGTFHGLSFGFSQLIKKKKIPIEISKIIFNNILKGINFLKITDVLVTDKCITTDKNTNCSLWRHNNKGEIYVSNPQVKICLTPS